MRGETDTEEQYVPERIRSPESSYSGGVSPGNDGCDGFLPDDPVKEETVNE